MISLTNVSRAFASLPNPVLDGIDLTLKPGDFCVLTGANGCGKSTLLKLIAGYFEADSGCIKIEGGVIQVEQSVTAGLVPGMTVLENVCLSTPIKPSFRLYGRARVEVAKQLKELNFGLEKYLDQDIRVLSGGQKQLLATFMAISSGAKVLLLDEHTAALDPKMQNVLMEYTASEIARKNLTTIMITHKMEDAIKYGNRLIMLRRGKIALDLQGEEKRGVCARDLVSLFYR